jgi:hypothetical protein
MDGKAAAGPRSGPTWASENAARRQRDRADAKETSLTGHWVSESGPVGGPGQEFMHQTVGDCLLR